MLFATIAAGGGHMATANAMAEAVTGASAGALRSRVSDIMAEYGPRELDRRHKESWRRLLATPRLVRLGQVLTDAAPAATRFLQDALLDRFAREVTAALNAEGPALVVVNHGWLATAFTLARRRHGLKARVVIYATEPFDASALWSTPAAEVVLAPSAAAKASLVGVGVPAHKVLVAGYPVADRFLAPPTREAARQSLGLDDGFTCLVTLGAEGVVSSAADAALLALASAGVNLLCVTGRNAALKARLEELFAVGPAPAPVDGGRTVGKVAVFGFVPDMERLLVAADLVIGKAGPASTMEALAVGRPVLATAYAGLNELAVTRFLATRGLGDHVKGWTRLPDAVLGWRADGQRAATARRAAQRLDFGAMKRGLGAYLAACARAGPAQHGGREAAAARSGPAIAGAPAGSFLDLADRLEPGEFAAVTRASLLGEPAAPARGVR